jgi:hypothetical protein
VDRDHRDGDHHGPAQPWGVHVNDWLRFLLAYVVGFGMVWGWQHQDSMPAAARWIFTGLVVIIMGNHLVAYMRARYGRRRS